MTMLNNQMVKNDKNHSCPQEKLWFLCDYGVILYMDGIPMCMFWGTCLGKKPRNLWQLAALSVPNGQASRSNWHAPHSAAWHTKNGGIHFIYFHITNLTHSLSETTYSHHTQNIWLRMKHVKSLAPCCSSPAPSSAPHRIAIPEATRLLPVMDASVTSDSEMHSKHVTKQGYEKAAKVSTYINHTEQCCFFRKIL